jgi:hypothetical protein
MAKIFTSKYDNHLKLDRQKKFCASFWAKFNTIISDLKEKFKSFVQNSILAANEPENL